MTAQLLKRLLAVALVVAAGLGFAGQASADYFLTNTVLNANDPNTGTSPLPGITTIDIAGFRFYTNNQDATAGIAVGQQVLTVFAGTVSVAHDDVSFGPPIHGPGTATTSISVEGAIQGTITAVSGASSTIAIQNGGFGLFAQAVPLNSQNPATWAPAGTAFATFTLAPPGNVFPGSGSPALSAQLTFPADQVNSSTVVVGNNNQSVGRAVFANGPGASAFLLPGSGPAPQPPLGLFSTFSQNVETSVTAGNSGLTAADLTLMNGLQAEFTPGTPVWATGIGAGPSTNWNPLFSGTSAVTGDFRAQGIPGVTLFPYGAAVPEPASLTLMGIGLGGLVLAIRRRKNKVLA